MSTSPPPSVPLPTLELSENVAIDRQQAAIAASRSAIRSPSRSARTAHHIDSPNEPGEDEAISMSLASLSVTPGSESTVADDEGTLSAL
ncbi:hypothetical protein GGI05_007793, partial [Coemansia sp. RSA 2603]